MNEEKYRLLKSYGIRISVYCIVAAVLFSASTIFQTTAGDAQLDYYILRDADWKKVQASGVQIVEIYDTALLVKVSDFQLQQLKDANYKIEPIPERTIIEVGEYRFDTSHSLPVLPPDLKIDASEHCIVQFVGPIKEDWKTIVKECGATLYDTDYVYKFAFYAKMDDETKAKVSNLRFVEWIGINQPAYKIRIPHWKERFSSEIPTTLFVYETADLDVLVKKLEGMNIAVEQILLGTNAVYATVPVEKFAAVARIEEVEWLYERPSLKLFNDRAGEIDMAHYVWYPETNGLGLTLTGLNQIAAIFDTGFDRGSATTGHYDFFRGPVAHAGASPGDRVLKVVPPNGYDTEMHGTHVAGIILGNGWCWEKWFNNPNLGPTDAFDYRRTPAGVAPEAVLVSYKPIANAITNWPYAFGDGARVLSNSWGPQTVMNGYFPDVDRFYHNGHQDALVVFAGGNDGPANYTVSGYGNNWDGLSAGARENNRPEKGADSDDPTQIADFSGRGPSAFVSGAVEVVKPDLVTVGTNVLSTRTSQVDFDPDRDPYTGVFVDAHPDGGNGRPDYILMSGTSMACPRLAGGAILVRQYYQDYEGIATPWVELIKATLINGGDDIGYGYTTSPTLNSAVNKDQGWGGMNLKNSICPDPPASNNYATHLFTGSYQKWYPVSPLRVVSDRVPLKVTLVWANPVDARPGNKLNLIVTSPSGVEYRGNQFENSVSKPNPAAFDDANNVEMVLIPSPETGFWNITVDCTQYTSWGRAAVVVSADMGPKVMHKIDLKAISTPQIVVAPGGTGILQLEVLNYGKTTETIRLSDNAPSGITVTYQPASSFTLGIGGQQSIVAVISAASTMTDGSVKFKISAETLPAPPSSKDFLYVKVDICSVRLPKVVQVTTHPGSQTEPYVLAFNHMGADYVFVAYLTETSYGTRIELVISDDGGNTFGTPIRIRNPSSGNKADSPNTVGLCWLNSGTYAGRVILWWRGNDPDAADPELSYWFCIAFSDYPYTSWTPVKVDVNSGDDPSYSNYKRTVFVVPRPAHNQLIAVNEILSSAPGATTPSKIYLISFVSNNGGETWSSMSSLPDGVDPSTNPHFFPNGFLDVNGNVWVHYYVSYNTYRVSRTVRWSGTPGDWETPKKVTENIQQNYMFPVGISTVEGPIGNRIYYAYTNSTHHAEVKQARIRYSDNAAAGGNTWVPPWNDATNPDGYGPIGGGLVSQAGYTTKPVLDLDKTDNNYLWLTYIEEGYPQNPYGAPNVYVAYTQDVSRPWSVYRLTSDSFSKSQKVTSALRNTLYTVYAANTAGNMDIWLRIYTLGFETQPDTVGPDVASVDASPNPTYGATEVNITANLIEFNTGKSNIAAAEYFVDSLGTAGTGTPMRAIDGAFDSPSEGAIATISTAGWNVGEVHTIYVRAKDSARNWGVARSVDVKVTEEITISFPEITVFSPVGGELWWQGNTYTIKWKIANGTAPYKVKIEYSTDGGATYNLIVDLQNQPAGMGEYNWTIPTTITPSRNCKMKITLTDAKNDYTEYVSGRFTIGAANKIYLSQGWNFISIPTEQPDERLEVVLGDIAGKYDVVQYYDASATDHWKVYDTSKPAYLRDLRTIDNKIGFWIHMTEPAVYNITGNWPSAETAIQLYAGWNMIGYPSSAGQTVSDAGAQLPAGYIIQCYDETANYNLRTMRGDEYLQPCSAYWVYVTSSCTLRVPP